MTNHCKHSFVFAQEVLNAEGGPGDSLGMMYGTLLRNYEAVKEDYSLIRKRYDDLVSSHSAAVNKLEHSQVRKIHFHHVNSKLRIIQSSIIYIICYTIKVVQ